jgi:hypothetical protein
MSRNLQIALAFGAFAAFLSVSASFALADGPAPTVGGDQYRPVQSLTYDFGSKSTSGFFVQKDGGCQVVLMLSEKVDPDAAAHATPVRVRLDLKPGQAAGLDSEEGQSLALACGEGAATLVVTAGSNEVPQVAAQDK